MSLQRDESSRLQRINVDSGEKIEYVAGAVRLYRGEDSNWTFTDLFGVLVISADKSKHSAHFRIFDVDTQQELWKYEMYYSMMLSPVNDSFVCFESDSCYIAFSFAVPSEGREFGNKYTKYVPKERKEKKKSKGGGIGGFFRGLFGGNKSKEPVDDLPPPVIGGPEDFQENVGLKMTNEGDGKSIAVEGLPPALRDALKQVGASKRELRDPEVGEALFMMIVKAASGTLVDDDLIHLFEAIKSVRAKKRGGKAPPPPRGGPPNRPPPVAPATSTVPTADGVPTAPPLPTAGVPTAPPLPTAGVPTAPPLPTAGVPTAPSVPTAPPLPAQGGAAPAAPPLPAGGAPGGLLSAIRGFDSSKLKKADTPPSTPPPARGGGGGGGDLLSQIRGFNASKLKKASDHKLPERPLNENEQKGAIVLADAIRNAVGRIAIATRGADDEDDDDSDY